MHHEPAPKLEKDTASALKTKLGIKLFAVYAFIYAGFVFINTLSPSTMEIKIFAGLNLAVVYGFGLIILAILMGLVYNWVCTNYENKMNSAEAKIEQEKES